jgi:hypothetical protein
MTTSTNVSPQTKFTKLRDSHRSDQYRREAGIIILLLQWLFDDGDFL